MSNYTYLMKCADGTLYCGWTNCLERRLEAHNSGKGAKYTRSRRPVALAYWERFATKEEAMSREQAIKRLGRKEKEKLIQMGIERRKEMAAHINRLGTFCGMRDVPELTGRALKERYGFSQADVMVLFGGSILSGGDVLAQAMKEGAARRYVIVGGAGHTTETLRRRMKEELPGLKTAGKSEAELFAAYIKEKYGLEADALECRSTNCGNNVTYLLELLWEREFPHETVILCQDATMQRRIDAGMRLAAPAGTVIVNYAAYRAEVEENGSLSFRQPPAGMWEMERYISLLLGEIPRLTDDENGYGPCGKGFIAHVEVPEDVRASFEALKEEFPDLVREANPAFSAPKPSASQGIPLP